MTAAASIVGILGGMGPAAGADFARLFVEACAARLKQEGRAVTDQAYPEHWLAQVPVPDRTRALESAGAAEHQPLEPMLHAVERLAAVGVGHLAIACNTAHAWHAAIQERFPRMEVLHIAHEVGRELAASGAVRVGLLATRGTYASGIYQQAWANAAWACHLPTETERDTLMSGIYEGVKASNLDLARARFESVAIALAERHGLDVLVLACTEIPLVLRDLPALPRVRLLDPAQVLATALAGRALHL